MLTWHFPAFWQDAGDTPTPPSNVLGKRGQAGLSQGCGAASPSQETTPPSPPFIFSQVFWAENYLHSCHLGALVCSVYNSESARRSTQSLENCSASSSCSQKKGRGRARRGGKDMIPDPSSACWGGLRRHRGKFAGAGAGGVGGGCWRSAFRCLLRKLDMLYCSGAGLSSPQAPKTRALS